MFQIEYTELVQEKRKC